MAELLAITSEGTHKPISEFSDEERWWCDGQECGDEPGSPHVHCMMHRHEVDLFSGRNVTDG